MTETMTVQQAVEDVPVAQWTDRNGEAWSSRDILNHWSADDLSQPVKWDENEMGQVELTGTDGTVVLTMLPPSGAGVPSEPPVAPEE